MNAVDTNWLEAMFFDPRDEGGKARRATVDRFLRTQQRGQLLVSQIVILEARNVFSRASARPEPDAWTKFEVDRRFYRDSLDWDKTKRDVFALVFRYGHKLTLGTFDLAVLASSRLSGATRLLVFDETLKAVATAEGLEVFPPLDEKGQAVLAKLRA
jgi:predicted nucleic acid-binding protein